MIKVVARRSFARASFTIFPQIFEWNRVPARFFAMVHSALSDEIAVNPGDFSAASEKNLGDMMARYSVFGGSSNISLHPDRLSMEFPVLMPGDSDLAQRIVERVFLAFRRDFPDHSFVAVQINLADHADILEGGTASDYLARYAIPSVESAFGEGNIVYRPGIRFGAVDAAAAWEVRCAVEKSDLQPNGLYVSLDLNFRNIDEGSSSFQELYGLYDTLAGRCSTALELEWENAT